ncbi:MAG: NAD-dependent epimerase/dehydratase family protein [Alphaproteobacteria bacterium]|nr:NAD-dependent epimerase/dehydratase family protein [Alphaproteobacteria bacterium]
MSILVTGAAGFIGFHLCRTLLEAGEEVIGIDNFTPYYDVGLKKARLAEIESSRHFTFLPLDFSDKHALFEALEDERIDRILHMGAQPGVRYSIDNPDTYASANLVGHLNLLELARHKSGMAHMVYASSSSVYGGSTELPYSEDNPVNQPISLYAATKRADELMSHSYAHLYELPLTGLRFFTVYGPWGRPDMAVWLFTKLIYEGKPVRLFNDGELWRDFTFIDDVVAGTLGVLEKPPSEVPSHRVLNIGNHKPEKVPDLVALIENALGKKAVIETAPMQPGDVLQTFADIDAIHALTGFKPRTSLAEGVEKFVDWYCAYRERAR